MTHLRKTSDGGWEVRITVPADCRQVLGKANLTKRLGRVNRSQANRLAAPIVSGFRQAIERSRAVGRNPIVNAHQLSCPLYLAGMSAPSKEITDEDAGKALSGLERTFLSLLNGYAQERQPAPDTLKRWRRALDSLSTHICHDDPHRVTQDDIVSWKMSLLAEGKAKARTVRNTYIAGVKAVFGWAVENRHIKANPASNITVRAPRKMKLRDRSFLPSEVQAILQACLAQRQLGLSEHVWRARRWLPWICAYSGARVGEIAQLRGVDVTQKDNHWVMSITPSAGRVKTGVARLVPIHAHLIETGFLEMVKVAGAGPLFYRPGCQPANIASKIGSWVREIGVTDRAVQPSHAWRHLWKTIARSAGIEADVRDAIQGHATRTEGEQYGEWMIEALADAIAKFPRFDISVPEPDNV